MRYTDRVQDISLFIKLTIFLLITILLMFNSKANAQQMIVDDAAITTERSFQVETWYGEYESVFMPAIGVNSWLEIGAGLLFESVNEFNFAGWMIEAKGVSGDFEETGYALGLVTGAVFNDETELDELYVYIPYSRLVLNSSTVLHLNAGLAFHNFDDDLHIDLIYGIRADFGLHERFTLLSEIFAANDDFLFHGGIGVSLIPGILQMDVTYGRGFQTGQSFPGLNIGLAFTPDSLW